MILNLTFTYSGRTYDAKAHRYTKPPMSTNKYLPELEYFVDSIIPNDLPFQAVTFIADKKEKAFRFNGVNPDHLPLLALIAGSIKQACQADNISAFE